MIKELFISEVRVNLIKFFIRNQEAEFHIRALAREIGVEINAIRRELDNLTNINFLIKKPWGNKIYYRVNKDSPYLSDFFSMISKEEGICKKILGSISHLGQISYLAISKEYLMGRPASVLELDLLIVGAPNQTFLENFISSYEKENREINYTVLSDIDFLNRKKKVDSFVIKFLIQPKIMLIGDEISFSKLI